jgi:uncharacterized protein YuzE
MEGMRLTYDLDAGALYIGLSDQDVSRTRQVDDNTLVDLDAAGCPVGIEITSIEHSWAVDEVLRGFDIPEREAAQIRAYFRSSERGAAVPIPHVSASRVPAECAA